MEKLIKETNAVIGISLGVLMSLIPITLIAFFIEEEHSFIYAAVLLAIAVAGGTIGYFCFQPEDRSEYDS